MPAIKFPEEATKTIPDNSLSKQGTSTSLLLGHILSRLDKYNYKTMNWLIRISLTRFSTTSVIFFQNRRNFANMFFKN